MLKIGVIGAVISALCCFTPVLVWVLVPLGLTGATMIYLEIGLLTALFIFSGMAIFAMIVRSGTQKVNDD